MTEPASASGQPLGRLRRVAPSLIGVFLAGVVVALFRLSGTAADTGDALQVMGFDPDRARLLTALMSTAMAAAIVALAGAPTALGVIAGLATGILSFGHTALVETRAALTAHGTQGTFDPFGWVVSVVTFAVAFAVAGWAAAVLARETRHGVAAAAVTIRDLVRGRDRTRAGARLAAATGVLLSLAIIAAALPILGDMLNFDPDVHMRRDAAGVPGALDPGTGSDASAVPSASATPVAGGGTGASTDTGSGSPGSAPSYPPGLVAGPRPASLITRGAVSAARPWWSARPSGHGRVMAVSLPAPWTGGIASTIVIDVYLPPGYDSGSARYPVIYEAPFSAASWVRGTRLPSMLDTLITGGSIPPVIVVFVSVSGGPYPDSECADSADGRQWIDRFVATSLVSWVDANLRTVATPASRATFGFSQGGYCSAALLAHHPDVFGSSIVFSGYFVAGIHSGTTPNAWRPFNNNPAGMDAVSPMTVVPRIPASLRASLFFVLEADPTNGLYGTQIEKFAAVLRAAGIALAILPTPLGHSWDAVRQLVPTMLELVAGRMVNLGVFGPHV
jgi:enterochelin esterase-like enzyme